ncbi:MAG: hypothetical protein Q8R26_02545 [bacterium]|nr:hypothetical protein [bacterium]
MSGTENFLFLEDMVFLKKLLTTIFKSEVCMHTEKMLAFQLFYHGSSDVAVATKLHIPFKQARQYYKQHLAIESSHKETYSRPEITDAYLSALNAEQQELKRREQFLVSHFTGITEMYTPI